MGFPNPGMVSVRTQLKKMATHKSVPLFINIGKNRDTANEKAFQDYCSCMETLRGLGDGFVINVSSPNTKNLRDLQKGTALKDLLEALLDFKKGSKISEPLLLKLSPDLSAEELVQSIEQSKDKVDGYILTNTTRSRPNGIAFPSEGGLSGRPLCGRSLASLKVLVNHLGASAGDRPLVISVGGISSAEDIRERLDAGADLVQVYSALVFEGPLFFQRLGKS